MLQKKLTKIIKENNINILHVRSRAPSWLLPYINKKNLMSVSTFHNIYGHQNIIKKIYNNQLCNVDKIITISEYVRNAIIKIYNINPNKITIINRGTDVEFFNPNIINDENFSNFISAKNIDSKKRIILYPGRFTEWKGQIEFLNIVESFKDKSIKFYFAGDDKNTSYYNKFIKEVNKRNLNNNCHVLGHLNKNELKTMYWCSDLGYFSSFKTRGIWQNNKRNFINEKNCFGL